jgi:hypothetical protein
MPSMFVLFRLIVGDADNKTVTIERVTAAARIPHVVTKNTALTTAI